jgi:hypothetical protein
MSIRLAAFAGVLAASFATAPVQAQQLPPDVYAALSQLYQTASFYCQNGVQVSCQTAMAIDQQAGAMAHALAACQQGNQEACGWYQYAVQQVSVAYQTTYSGGQMSGGNQTFDMNAMTQQHLQNQQTLQNQFNAGQQRYQQQQQLNDQMFQTYMNTLK